MSYPEAIEDGIRISDNKRDYAIPEYFPLCSICGKEVKKASYDRNEHYFCKECRETKEILKRMDKSKKRVIKNSKTKERKFKEAVRRILKVGSINSYDYAIACVEEALHNDGWFDSTEEIMVGIELIKNGLNPMHQVKCGRAYRVDFMLQEQKVIIEVDGSIFHAGKRAEEDKKRDFAIIEELGEEWEIVRIPDNLINKDITTLLNFINSTIIEKRKEKMIKS